MSCPSPRRVRLHARIAETLESLYGDDAEAHAGELAHHLDQAALIAGTEKLVKYSLLAGEQALTTYAYEEALSHFQRGLSARGVILEGREPAKDAQAAALLFGLGRTQVAIVDRLRLQQAIDNLHRAFDYYAQAGDVTRAVAVAEWPYFNSPSSPTGMAQIIAHALTLVPPDSYQAGRLLPRYGSVLALEEGEQQGAQEAFSRALAIAHQIQDDELELRTLAEAALVDRYQRRFQESLKKSLRAIELARRVDDLPSGLTVRYEAALALEVLGDPEAARRHAAEMLALAERLRDRSWVGAALYQLTRLSSGQGHWGTARGFSDRGLAMSTVNSRDLSRRILLEYETGNFDQGEAYLERLLESMRLDPPGPTAPYMYPAFVIPAVARITGDASGLEVGEEAARAVLESPSATHVVATFARFGLGLLAVRRDDASTAGEQYAALEPERNTMLVGGLGATDRLLGLLTQTMGNIDTAARHFEDALAFCRKAGYRPELAWSLCDYADMLLERKEDGDSEKAVAMLDESLAISTELGMRPLMERVLSRREILKA